MNDHVTACECNGWSTRCRFNEELYMESRRGGECIDCGGNRDGPHCEICQAATNIDSQALLTIQL